VDGEHRLDYRPEHLAAEPLQFLLDSGQIRRQQDRSCCRHRGRERRA